MSAPVEKQPCDGSCCVMFCVGGDRSLEEVKRDADDLQDGAYIADMLVPLNRRQQLARARRFGTTIPVNDGVPRFKCRHWDEKTRLCKEYDARPRMCSQFPYGKECIHGECGCVGEKQGS